MRRRLLTLCTLFLATALHAQLNPDWTTPVPPFQIADNLYYVGSRDLATYLITTPRWQYPHQPIPRKLTAAHPRQHRSARLPLRRHQDRPQQPGPL